MKKIFFLLLPMFVIIAMVFTIRNKNITWVSFLQFIQALRFDNAISSINNAVANMRNSVKAFGSIGNSGGILTMLYNIATGLSKWFMAMFYLTKSAFDVVLDIGNNLFIITDFLFGTEIRS